MSQLVAALVAARHADAQLKELHEQLSVAVQASTVLRGRALAAAQATEAAEAALAALYGWRLLPALLASSELLQCVESLRDRHFSLLLCMSGDHCLCVTTALDNRAVAALLRTCKQIAAFAAETWVSRKRTCGLLGRNVGKRTCVNSDRPLVDARATTARVARASTINHLVALPDGTLVAGGGHRVYFWRDCTSAAPTSCKLEHDGMRLSPKGCHMVMLPHRRIATSGVRHGQAVIFVWDMDSITLSATLCAPLRHGFDHGDYIEYLATAGDYLMSAQGGEVIVWQFLEVGRWRRFARWSHGHCNHNRPVRARVESMVVLNGGTIATACAQDGCRLWLHWQQDDTLKVAVCAGHQPKDLPWSADTAQQPEWVYSMVALTDGRVASGSWSGRVKVWNADGTCAHTHDNEDHSKIDCLAALPDGAFAVAYTRGDHHGAGGRLVKIRCYVQSGAIAWEQTMGPRDTVYSMSMLSQEHLVCMGKSLSVLDRASGANVTDPALKCILVGGSGASGSPAVLPNGIVVTLDHALDVYNGHNPSRYRSDQEFGIHL